MSLLGSSLGRGIAGAGAAAATLSNKYIDEEMAADKAKFMAQLQHSSAVKMDQYNLSAPRQTQLRTNATDATLAQGAATRQSELAGLNDTGYQTAVQGKKDSDAAAETKREIAKIEALTPAQIAAKNATTEGTMTLEAQREALITEARERIKAKYDRTAGAGGGAGGTGSSLKLPPGVKAELDALDKRDEQINAALVRAQADGSWDPEKNPSQKQLIATQRATQLKRAQLIAPYLPGTKPGGADPLGIMGDTTASAASGAPAAPAPAPAAPSLWERAKAAKGGAASPVREEPVQAIPGPAGAAIEQAGQALDAARETRSQARDTFYKFGQRQRAADPAGFQRAKGAYEEAQKVVAEAEKSYQSLVWNSNFGGERRVPRP